MTNWDIDYQWGIGTVKLPWSVELMNCPHCGKRISRKQLASGLGKIKSDRKAQSSAENGKLGGRPRKTS